MSERPPVGPMPALAPMAEWVAARFGGGRALLTTEPLGSGHIHATVLARYAQGPALVLQRLNAYVFRDLDAVMTNVARVTAQLRATLEEKGARDLERRVLCLARTPEGDDRVGDSEGEMWRAWLHIDRSQAHDVATSDEIARRAACAFGEFAAALADLPAAELADTLPGYHDTRAHLARLAAVWSADERGLAREVDGEVERTLALAASVLDALDDGGAAGVPARVVHNDCKINNVLFDRDTDEALCVVDLDTTMAGALFLDFGDLVRSGACTAREDEEDPTRLRADPARLAALAQGYLAGLGAAVTPEESELLWLGGPLRTVEDAARFLVDHLEGDLYFPAHRPGHNRIRGRAQLALAETLWAGREALRRAVSGAARAAAGR